MPVETTLLVLSFLAAALATVAAGRLRRFPLPSNRIGCVDGLRGYLALSVMCHHFIVRMGVQAGRDWEPPAENLFNQMGAAAVALFFMTTGLVFYPRVKAGFGGTSWRATFITRVFRIVPLTAFSTLLVVLLIVWTTGAAPSTADLKPFLFWITAHSQPPLLGYADSGRLNAFVLWSLKYEWLFYLMVLPGCALLRDLIRPLPAWLIPAGMLAGSFALRALGAPIIILAYLPLFAVGMLVHEAKDRLPMLKDWRAGAAGLAALIAGMVSGPSPYEPLQVTLFGFFFLCVASGNSVFGLLSTRGALVLGECSFSIYLLHGLVLSILFLGPVEAWALPLAAVAVALLTAATYLWVERPCIRAGKLLAGPAPMTRAQVEVGA